MMKKMLRLSFIGVLVFITITIFAYSSPRELTVSFLDVGQGDAVLISAPGGAQVLIDAGATRGVLRELSRAMPLFDQSLDAVVATHPDQDHVGGLLHVLNRYDVKYVFESGNLSQSPAYTAYAQARDSEGARTVLARRGMRLSLGAGPFIDVLFPDRDVSGVESNAASVVLRVVYGDTEVLLTGDAPASIERYLLSLYGTQLESDALKAGHHGSNTSSDAAFLDAVSPEIAVFSRGCENRYGHPSPDVVERFSARRVPLYDTCEVGTVTLQSDGRTFSVRSRN